VRQRVNGFARWPPQTLKRGGLSEDLQTHFPGLGEVLLGDVVGLA
jgi:hypothetical protein